MAYVDLNPVRAGAAQSIEDFHFTSGRQRFREMNDPRARSVDTSAPALLPLIEDFRQDEARGVSFGLRDYFELLETSGRAIHPAWRGALPAAAPRLLVAFGLEAEEWMKNMTDLHVRFRLFIGAPHRLARLAERRGWRWIRGQLAARRLYAHEHP